MELHVFQGIALPLLGTTLGSACVLFMKNKLNPVLQRALTGFAAGVMVAASVWSLLIPAMEQSEALELWAFMPAVMGFWIGILFLLFLDRTIPHLHMNSNKAEGPKSNMTKTTMLVLAVTLHNLPEGMTVGVVYAGWISGDTGITAMGALAPSLEIAIQNFPEGAIISMPLRAEGMRKGKAFLRRAFRNRGAGRGGVDHSVGRLCGSSSPIPFEFRSRRNGLCNGEGADSGDVGRGTFQCGNCVFLQQALRS